MKEIQSVSISATTDTTNINRLIYTTRSQQVILASDLAMLYQVETRVLNQAVKRNQKRFPGRYCFQLTKEEANLTSQIVMSSSAYGGQRSPPYAFTEQSIAMLSAILRRNISVELVKTTSRKFG
ncbi:ORF6N domain-containing protein [Selenomonas felix]|uniref:ORF6N domain-containing protein n=1 Tax=Selenomonas felix TaxID=1944634 RepID=UPI000C850B57|nr:ORF6N domain-containing protein [Selenomonas felix]